MYRKISRFNDRGVDSDETSDSETEDAVNVSSSTANSAVTTSVVTASGVISSAVTVLVPDKKASKKDRTIKKGRHHEIVKVLNQIRDDNVSAINKKTSQQRAMEVFDKATKTQNLTVTQKLNAKRKFKDLNEADFFLGLSGDEQDEWIETSL